MISRMTQSTSTKSLRSHQPAMHPDLLTDRHDGLKLYHHRMGVLLLPVHDISGEKERKLTTRG